ncbi:MAG: lamin tail domain-containing protein [Acidimicrobiia bacterium]|nr:lamin tail domain-containing protein [Acidimicrobiia bacterium]
MTATSTERPSDAVRARVLRVDDGDSVVVAVGGIEQKVRLIGINSPERDECLSDGARATLEDLIAGREVLLESDIEPTDQFERWLRYVWLDDRFINAEIVGRGMAIARAFEPNTARQAMLETAEADARAGGLGIWDPNACGGEASSVVIEVVQLSENPPGRDEDDLNGEFIVLENRGDTVDLSGYVLRDGSSANRFRFPNGYVFEAARRVVVFVGCGDNSAEELYWCASGPVWDNQGDQAFLVAPTGGFVATYEYP